MASDNETHIRRPKPGGNRIAGGPAASPRNNPEERDGRARRAGNPGDLGDFVAAGRNRILAAAGPLLSLGARLQASVFQADVPALRRQAAAAVERFAEQALKAGVSQDEMELARYILCTFVDQAVFETPWGSQGDWASRCLLLSFQQELDGGEKFFQLLDRMSEDSARRLDLLELQYVCLLLGFSGKYRHDSPGLDAVRERLAALLRRHRRADVGSTLSAHWQGEEDRRSRVLNLLPWWIVGLVGIVILLGIWLVLRHQLVELGAPLRARLAQQGVPMPVAAEPGPVPSLRLKPLLAPQTQAGQVLVTEHGAQSTVTLLGSDLFASGGASLSPGHRDTIRQIGAAIEKVPGTVTVVGHTDDQPVRSLRYQDNFELSRARAVAVATLLRESLSDASRIQWSGVGETQPLYTPASLPENRARNRRVEIVHVAVSAGSSGGTP